MTEPTMQDAVLLMHPSDDVAVATAELRAGRCVVAGDRKIEVRTSIPFGHKVAVRDIEPGAKVVKYGQPIGVATQRIRVGEHVHGHNLESTRGRGDLVGSETPAVWRPAPIAGHSAVTRLALSGAEGRPGNRDEVSHAARLPLTFAGYRRPDGSVGIRNHVLIIASVSCANTVVDRIERQVERIVAITHSQGCSQIGADAEQTERVLLAYGLHPNAAAVLYIGLGCETMPTRELAARVSATGKAARCLIIQEEGGTSRTVVRGLAIARELQETVAQYHREPIPLAELIVGTECGGSDAWSGVTANPALGIASDRLVAAGGTVLLSETPEFIGAEHVLAARAVDEAVGRRILEIVRKREEQAMAMGVDLRGAQPTPGNVAGGLTTIEEKSLGTIFKGGTTPLQEVIGYGQRPTRRGLVIMDTPGNDVESVTGMVAGGAHVVVFTTGRGSPTGNPIAPVLKVASNTPMFRRMEENMDMDAGSVLMGKEPLNEAGLRMFDEIIAVAGGKRTKAEVLRHHEFAINAIGPRL